MDELEKILGIVGKYGWQPILSTVVLMLALRLGRPEVLSPAVSRVYVDVCRAIGTWWESHRELVEAQRDARRAQEARDRALESAWSVAHPEGTRAVDRLVYGPASRGGDPRATGERPSLEAPAGVVGAGGGRTAGPAVSGDDDRDVPVPATGR